MVAPPNKRLKLAARVGYLMTTLSPARRSLSAIRYAAGANAGCI